MTVWDDQDHRAIMKEPPARTLQDEEGADNCEEWVSVEFPETVHADKSSSSFAGEMEPFLLVSDHEVISVPPPGLPSWYHPAVIPEAVYTVRNMGYPGHFLRGRTLGAINLVVTNQISPWQEWTWRKPPQYDATNHHPVRLNCHSCAHGTFLRGNLDLTVDMAPHAREWEQWKLIPVETNPGEENDEDDDYECVPESPGRIFYLQSYHGTYLSAVPSSSLSSPSPSPPEIGVHLVPNPPGRAESAPLSPSTKAAMWIIRQVTKIE